MRGEWIEIEKLYNISCWGMSLPMRGEWIEITCGATTNHKNIVSPHAGRVD